MATPALIAATAATPVAARVQYPSAAARQTAGDAKTRGEGRSNHRFCQNEAELRVAPEA